MNAVQQAEAAVRTRSHSHVPKAAIAGVAMVAVVVGSIVAASVLSGVIGSRGARLTDDHSYDAIENARGLIVVSRAADDHSFDAIENARGLIVVSSAADDHSFDAIENARGRMD